MHSETFFVPNGDGWTLAVKRTWVAKKLIRSARPMVLLAGFGNNASVFAYPDQERSMEGFFAQQGREVWSANLRAQGGSKRTGGNRVFGVQDMALVDLVHVLNFIRDNTLTSCSQVDGLGASLGGTLLFIHSAMRAGHSLASIVAIGSPLRWSPAHPVVAAMTKRTDWIKWLPIRGSRLFLKAAFPLLRQLSVGIEAYIHPDKLASPDISRLIETIDDPNRHVMKQLAGWFSSEDLILNGANLTELFNESRCPLLCVLSNRDRVVPAKASLSAIKYSGATKKDVLHVGDDELPFAHTDPLVHQDAPKRVFAPIWAWLEQLRKEESCNA